MYSKTLQKEIEKLIELENLDCSIEEFATKVDWESIFYKYQLSEPFMDKHWEDLNKVCISRWQKLSESFIEKHWEDLDKYWISKYQKLSESFMEKHCKDLNKYYISGYQKLSESFMEKHWEDLDKECISKYQKLSESFMDKHWEDLDKYWISKYQKLSESFMQKYNLTIDEDNWLYKDYNFKLDYIKNNTSYEIVDDSIIAYKSVRSDNYSIFNFQYLYEVGKIYESHCDCTNNENSFGLSAWTKKDALEYNDTGKLLKVKIKINDIGRIVHDNGKIRCFRFEVLEEIK